MDLVAAVLLATTVGAQNPPPAQTPPATTSTQAAPFVPKPFPQPQAGTPAGTAAGQSAQSPAAPPTAAQAPAPPSGKPTEATLGAPIYSGAEFLDSIDAGQGQRYYLFGTNAPYSDVVAYYRQALKTGSRELFKAPAMQQFDLGKYQEESMAYPPSVVVKDYTWNGSPGYLHVSGTTEKRFATIIQIVPAPAR